MEVMFTVKDMYDAFTTGILAEAVDADLDETFNQYMLEKYGVPIPCNTVESGLDCSMKPEKEVTE